MIMVFGGVVESPACQQFQSRKKPGLYLWNGKQAWIISLNILEFFIYIRDVTKPNQAKTNKLLWYQ